MKRHHKIFIALAIILSAGSCKKFLDVKSNQNLSTPGTLKDLQALLDNQYFYRRGIALTQTGSDEYYLPFTVWQQQPEPRKSGHVWDAVVNDLTDWQNQYQNIFYANTVLDNWEKVAAKTPGQTANEIKGAALFFRSQCLFQLAQLFAPQYDPATAASDLGLPLRLDGDFNKPSQRASVQQTYEQIINDLETAVTLLPAVVSAKTRPSKAAGFALLARTYLQTGDYSKSKTAADQCLQLYNTLIDYNDNTEVDTTRSEPFLNKGILNKEIIWYLNEDGSINTLSSSAKIDSVLYGYYDANDIRKAAFFRPIGDGTYRFKGSYNGILSIGSFVGLGTAEVYLIRAEANARLGNKDEALQDLNTLLNNRYKTGSFVNITAATAAEALDIILRERKKEMVYRGMRWADLKRLNKEPARAVTLKRLMDGQTYTLPPNDLRYALLIPREVMELSNLQQNPR